GGTGVLRASLPNEARGGIDVMPGALEQAGQSDPTMHLSLADASSCKLGRKFDAIICDRLCHTVPDIQRLLQNLSAHLQPSGRLFLTAFNFLWWLPIRVGEKLGFKEPSPPQNWLSASDLENVFALTGLEAIHYDDRLPAAPPLRGADLSQSILLHLPALHAAAPRRAADGEQGERGRPCSQRGGQHRCGDPPDAGHGQGHRAHLRGGWLERRDARA